MIDFSYLMENDEEALRMELKTDAAIVENQARWAGLLPGMRIADVGCGPGKTTFALHGVVAPGGSSVGIDASEERIEYARTTYCAPNLDFVRKNILDRVSDLGKFDFIWSRFFLEYFRSTSFQIVRQLDSMLKPGGILCLIDLDYNCLSHFGMPDTLESTFASIMTRLERDADFDPYVGRKLYSFLYDLGYADIQVEVTAHHLIFGQLRATDAYNWSRKIDTVCKRIGYRFDNYQGGYGEFYDDFIRFFSDPRRFTYTPMILCRGRKPII